MSSVAKVIEISSQSKKSFEEAIRDGVARASETIHGITAAWVSNQQVDCDGGKIVGYRVNLRITFLLEAGKNKKKK